MFNLLYYIFITAEKIHDYITTETIHYQIHDIKNYYICIINRFQNIELVIG